MTTPGHGEEPRLLFGSYHCPLDPFSGAALSVRDLLGLLTGRGWRCRACAGPLLDAPQHIPLDRFLRDPRFASLVGPRFRQANHTGGSVPFSRFDLTPNGIPVTLVDTPGARPFQAPTPAEGRVFLALFEQALAEFRPHLLLTYGGFWLAPELIARARRHGVRVVFWLHNFAYQDAELFRQVDAVLVPSRFAADHYRSALGLSCTPLPPPLNWAQVRCAAVQGRYATFVNPEPNKGVFPFARLAVELARQRPDIPLLVVEGRGSVGWLKEAGLDFDALGNLHLLATTPDPRTFYRVSRLVLMPSLWQEAFGRVAAEALVNGIPVLASRRGGLPEVLAQAGSLLDIPESYTPASRVLPSAAEMTPWVDTIVRLWDDAACYARESQRCLAAAEAWRPEVLGRRYEDFFLRLLGRRPVADLSPVPAGGAGAATPPAPVIAAPEGVAAARPEAAGPDISVVMPVHNGAAFVERAIRSVLAQTFPNWELLVVDDGSGDDSYERVCRLAALDGRIRPFRLAENRGASAARNHALRQARGATIAYLDCDDEYYPDYLGRVHAWRGRADVLVCGYDLVEERPGAPNRGAMRSYNPVPHRDRILEVNIATPLGVAHGRALLDRVGLFDETNYTEQDWDLWKRFHRAGAVFLFSDRKSGLYHVRADSQARTDRTPDAARPGGTAPPASGQGSRP